MNKQLIWIVAMSAAVSVPGPAAACDLDGMPGFGGLHRFNPFAKAIAPAPEQRSSTSRSSNRDQSESSRNEERSQDRTNRNRQDEEGRPKRAWESDQGNGPMTAEDKATFT